MTWEEYCIKKKIDSSVFQKADPEKWNELKTIFEQVHPNSFTEQKKFLINDLRRRYHLAEEVKKEEGPKKTAGPVIKIPPKKL
jgi:hypothetical protein